MAKKKKHRKKAQRHSSRGAVATPAGSRPAATTSATAATPKTTAQPQPQPAAAPKLPASGAPALVSSGSAGGSTRPAAAASPSQTRPETTRWSYVGKDVRRVGALAIACVIIEAIIWFLFNHTGVGPAVINHITI